MERSNPTPEDRAYGYADNPLNPTGTPDYLWALDQLGVLQPADAILVGHSLVNHDVPQMIRQLGPVESTIQEQVINGASMNWNWNHAHEAEGINARTVLAGGGIDVFIIAEAGPVEAFASSTDEQPLYGWRWRKAAADGNPGIRALVYQTWPESDNDPTQALPANWPAWRGGIDTLRPSWERIVRAGGFASLVPVGNAMAALYDEVEDGNVPGITSMAQLFTDDIHVNQLGNYFVACVMYSAIYRVSPVGLPNQLENPSETPYVPAPTPEQAAIFQQIAWDAWNAYSLPAALPAPTITSAAAIDVNSGVTLAHTLTASEAVQWWLVPIDLAPASVDVADFEISGAVLRWAGNVTRNIAAPADANADNDYVVVVGAVDTHGNTAYQTLTASVVSVAQVNLVPNSSLAGAALGAVPPTGTGGALPTTWYHDPWDLDPHPLIEVWEVGTETIGGASLPYIEFRFSKPSEHADGGIYRIEFDLWSSAIPSAPGTQYTGSFYARHTAGTWVAGQCDIYLESNGSTYAAGNGPQTITSSHALFDTTYTNIDGTATRMMFWITGVPAGAADFRFRLAGLQFEQGAARTTFQLTGGSTPNLPHV